MGMDLYVVNDAFERIGVVDNYTSLIWTDRYNEYGDFVLTLPWSQKYAALLIKGRKVTIGTPPSGEIIGIPQGQTMMVIDTVEVKATGEMTIKGLSMLSILEHRVIGTALSIAGGKYDVEDVDVYTFLTTMVENACGSAPKLKPEDAIPRLVVAGLKVYTDPAEDLDVPLGTVGGAVRSICQKFNVGVDMSWELDPFEPWESWYLMIKFYRGASRLSTDDWPGPVVFGPDLDSLANSSELSTIGNYKNVAYVFGKDKSIEVALTTPAPSGWDRRVLIVSATDILGTTTKATNKLKNRGLLELRKHNQVFGVDGEVSPTAPYKYGEHYFMGDIVELRTVTGTAIPMRVTEYIRTKDAEGIRAFPTLTAID